MKKKRNHNHTDEALRVSEERYRRLIEYSPISVAVVGLDGVIEYINRKARETFGYAPEDIPDMARWWVLAYPDEDYRQEVISSWMGHVEKALAENSEIKGSEYQVTCKDRTVKTMIISGVPVADKLLVLFNDITERKQAEEELKRYRDHLEEIIAERTRELSALNDQLRQSQKLEAVGLLAGGIAHDFSNILTTIKGSIHIIQKKLDSNSPVIKYTEQVLSSVGRATNLAQSLLAFGRKQTMALQPLSFNEIIRSMSGLLSQLIGEHIELKMVLTEKNPTIMADRSQIGQILLNLVTNARDAMPEGGTLGVQTDIIEVDKAFTNMHGDGTPGPYVLLTVSDTGSGMDDVIKGKIFEPFFTTKELDKGSGLGLAVTYGIVKQHGGYIDVDTFPSRGTTFNIYIPLVETAALRDNHSSMSAAAGRGETILLAEDDTAARKIMAEVLRLSGYKVVEAVDGEDTIRVFRNLKDVVDLVLLDVRMPRKDGREVFMEIMQERPETAVLFMSGYTDDIINSEKIVEHGLNFISKAASPEELLTRIREVLDT
ncbi:MAG: hypothetical protein C0402_08830 [Thermodesulfovibrio sp.]|nr:hypothetical protein [Thermodesulfovibrio sp.]